MQILTRCECNGTGWVRPIWLASVCVAQGGYCPCPTGDALYENDFRKAEAKANAGLPAMEAQPCE